MPYYSKNPILAAVATTDPFEATEIEVFIESPTTPDTFESLGVFTYTSDADGEVSEQIQTLLDAAMEIDILRTLPPVGETSPAEVPAACRKWYYRHRHYHSSAWTSWVDEEEDFVLQGGQAWEEFDNTFTTSAAAAPVLLSPEGSLLSPQVAEGWIYILCQAAAELTYTFQFYNKDGTNAATESGSITPARAFTVVRIPLALPAADKDPFFTLSFTVDGVTRSATLMADNSGHRVSYDFCYLNSRGGWSFLPTFTGQSRTLEVTQSLAESKPAANYHTQPEAAQYRVWRSTGRKKMRTATGFMPQDYLDVVAQDFLLSPHRYYWSDDLEKWIPIVVDTKNVEYRDDLTDFLRSFEFEFRTAFDNDLPSAL